MSSMSELIIKSVKLISFPLDSHTNSYVNDSLFSLSSWTVSSVKVNLSFLRPVSAILSRLHIIFRIVVMRHGMKL
jgi:hypothetical protein